MPKAKANRKRTGADYVKATKLAPFPARFANRIEIACDGAPDPEIAGVHIVRLMMRGALRPAEIAELTAWLLALLKAHTPPDMWVAKRGAQTWKKPKAGPPIGVAPPKPSPTRMH